jgi:hypothetical protein
MVRAEVPVLRSAVVAALLAAAAGCAGAGGAARTGQMPEAAAAYARPEPDPTCRATVRAPLIANGLERVTVKVAVDRTGKLTVLEFLSPDLTPAASLELRRAFAQCAWKPSVGPDGQPRDALTTLLFGAGK